VNRLERLKGVLDFAGFGCYKRQYRTFSLVQLLPSESAPRNCDCSNDQSNFFIRMLPHKAHLFPSVENGSTYQQPYQSNGCKYRNKKSNRIDNPEE
jgi:hypothetical protein